MEQEQVEQPASRPWGRRARRLLLGALIVAYAWVATGFRTFSHPAEVATAIPALFILVVAIRRGRDHVSVRVWLRELRVAFSFRHGPEGHPPSRSAGRIAWVVLILSLVGWEFFNLVQQPREDHPTISSVLDSAGAHPARAALFLLWLAFGWDLARR